MLAACGNYGAMSKDVLASATIAFVSFTISGMLVVAALCKQSQYVSELYNQHGIYKDVVPTPVVGPG